MSYENIKRDIIRMKNNGYEISDIYIYYKDYFDFEQIIHILAQENFE